MESRGSSKRSRNKSTEDSAPQQEFMQIRPLAAAIREVLTLQARGMKNIGGMIVPIKKTK